MRGPFFELTAWLYYLCFLLLAALLLLIALRRRPRPHRYKQRERRRPTRPDHILIINTSATCAAPFSRYRWHYCSGN